MSHAATNWAFEMPERFPDMKPGEWAVLMVLANCHNPVMGCFPSQDYICSRTNLSERAVRDQLGRLRDRGLINWDAARDDGRRGANRYSLGFEADFQPAESAGSPTGKTEPELPAESDTSNRQNLPPNLVREPVREPVKEPPPPPLPGGSAPSPSPMPDGWDAFEAAFTGDGVPILRHGLAVDVFAELTPAERAEATAGAAGYVRMRSAEKRPPQKLSAQTFLREKGGWAGFARLAPPPGKPGGDAPTAVIGPWDRAWWWLLLGLVARLGASLRDQGGAPRQRVQRIISLARSRIGWTVPRGEVEAIEAAAMGLQKAHVDGPEVAAWRAALWDLAGLDLPLPDAAAWVYLPPGEPGAWLAAAGEREREGEPA